MTDRKNQILNEAINILVTQGHVGLTMRAVARASDLKLGALQYHYATRLELIQALAHWIAEQTAANFKVYQTQAHTDKRDLHAMVDFLIDDPLVQVFDVDELFQQLWAMALTEPVIRELLDEMYELYLGFIEACLIKIGVQEARADALVILSILEGIPLFIGKGVDGTNMPLRVLRPYMHLLMRVIQINPRKRFEPTRVCKLA